MNFLVSGNCETIWQFQSVLKERGDAELLATFPDMLNRARIVDSGLAIIDTAAPGYEGEAGLKRLKLANASLKILLVGVPQSPKHELAALAAGAMGCCNPSLSEEQIRRILSIVEEGGVWISNAALPHLLDQLRKRSKAATEPQADSPPLQENSQKANAQKANLQSHDGMVVLTQREREISQMVAEGLSNKVIARRLDITDRTVKAHLTTVFQKLHVHDRLQLALYVTKGEQD